VILIDIYKNSATLSNMETTPNTLPARKSFIRLGDKKKVIALIKEAKRVGYTVDENKIEGRLFNVTVTDPENNNDLVFKSVNVRPGMWGTTYSTKYWVEKTD